MKTELIKKSIEISAPKEKVWDVLLNDKFTRIWYAEFSEGSHAETDWKVGSKALFTDKSNRGLVGKVIVNIPNEVISVEYQGLVMAGTEDYESDEAKNVKGARETYHLAEKNGVTRVSIECDMGEEWFESMSLAWDKALLKVKELSEGLVITRIFDAPRTLVFKAWTDPKQVIKWWGPKNFTAPVCKIDLRVGGEYLFCMRSPEGKEYWSKGAYKEIVEPERIVFTDSFADEEGNMVSASAYGMEGDWPLELQVIVTFDEQKDQTSFTLRHMGIPEGKMRELTEEGWNESLDKLAESLK